MSDQTRPIGRGFRAGWLAVELARTNTTLGLSAATELWSSYWDRLTVEDPAELLAGLTALPGEAFLHNPGLVVAGSYLQRLVTDGDPGRFGLDPRVNALLNSDVEHGAESRLTLLTGMIASTRTTGAPEAALQDIATARSVLQAASPGELARMTGPLANFRFQWARTLDAADDPAASHEYEQAYELAQLSEQPFLARRTAGHLAWYHADRGRLGLAESWLGRARSFHDPNPRYDAVLYLAAAILKLDRQDPAGAEVELARLSAVPVGENWAAELWVRSLHMRSTSEAAEVAARTTDELSRHTHAQCSSSANSRYIRATQLRLATHPRGISREPTVRAPAPFEHFAEAVEALHHKRYEQALHHSTRAWRLNTSPRISAAALLVHAVAQRASGEESQGIDTLRGAREIIDSGGLHTTYGVVPAAELHRLSTSGDVRRPRTHVGAASADARGDLTRLTARQREVLSRLTTDQSLGDIARELHISPNTLKTSLRAIYGTLGVNSRHAAADVIRRAALR